MIYAQSPSSQLFRLTQVHVYELTNHEDKYDLRYRLKDKIYIRSSAQSPSSKSAILSSPMTTESARLSGGKKNPKRPGQEGREDRPGSGDDGVSRDHGGGKGSDVQATFLLVTSSNVFLCDGRVLQLYNLAGVKV